MKAQEVVEELYERRQDAQESLRAHIADLKKRYGELNQKSARIPNRLLRAFPTLESRRHQERVLEMRRQLREKLKK